VSMKDVFVSRTARRGIRTFSVWVWVWGALVLFVGALNTFAVEQELVEDAAVEDVAVDLSPGITNPWEVAEPTVFESDGVTYSGSGGGVIRIPLEEHDQDPYAVTLRAGSYISLYATDAEDLGQPATDRSYPTGVTDIYGEGDEFLILPQDADLELWVDTQDAWEFTLQKAEVTEITNGFATGAHTGTGVGTGIGNRTNTRHLVYRGDAVSAQFSHRGTGPFLVTIRSLDSSPHDDSAYSAVNEIGDADQRASWDPTAAVYISIKTDDFYDAAWSIDIDELATDAPTPAPLTTTESTPR
jgi:hypothetical protein